MKPFFPVIFMVLAASAQGAVIFSQADPILVDEAAVVLPTGPLARSSTATDTLYFRYTVDPASDHTTENYFAAMQFFSMGGEGPGIGNAWGASAYSAYGTSVGDVDLNSSVPEAGQSWQLVRMTDLTTLVYRVQFVAGGNDNITVWLNPDFSLSEDGQAAALTTTFEGNATFDEIRLRQGGGGNGWTFSDIAVADSWNSIIPEPSVALLGGVGLLGLLRRRR